MTTPYLRSRALVLFLAAAVAAPYLAAEETLPSDSRNLTGKLPNGVTWIYRQHNNPPGKMAMLIHVRSGSLNETDTQRGLAHFIEHMGFNGTENFPPGKLLPYFESIGMEFGNDLNAFTSFDQTVYLLFLPDPKPEELDKGLMVLSDYAFRQSLLEEELNKERGVILEELRAGKSAEQRLMDKFFARVFAGTRFGERLPIGKEEVIKNAARAEFEGYYRTWYRPERITLIMVGDAELDPIRPLVEKWFAPYAPKAAGQPDKGAEFKPFTAQRAIVLTDPEFASAEISIANVGPGRPPTTTVTLARTDMVEHLATWIVDRRLNERLKKGQASYQSAGVMIANFFREAMLVGGQATGKPEDWNKMLDELVMELSRAREYGFTKRELELAKKEVLSSAERAVETEPTANAQGMMFQMMSAVNDREPIMSAQQKLDLTKQLLPTIELAEVSSAFQKHFAANTFAYVLKMPEKEGTKVPTEEELLAASRNALALKVEPPKEDEQADKLLATEPTPRKLVESTFDEQLAITSGWLENGARLHHRYMDYKKDTVLLSITLAGGQIEEKAENAGVSEVATLAFSQAATHRLTSMQITDLMTGKNISVQAGAGDDAFTVHVSGSPKDLETGLQLAYALLTDAKLEDSAFDTWKKSSLQQLAMVAKHPDFKAFEAFRDLVSGGDPRLTLPTPERVERQSVAAAQAWVERLCREAPIEVAVVGDLPLEQALPLVEKYIGSLPPRPRSTGNLDPLRKLSRKPGPLEARVQVETITDKGMAIYGFVGADNRTIDDVRQLRMASNIIESRVIKRIREELSLVYSPMVTSQPGVAYVDSGFFLAGAPCDPAKVDEFIKEAEGIFRAFADTGPTAEEQENARKQVLNDLDKTMREPSYWWGILQNHDLHGINLEKLKTIKEDYQAYTAEQVRDVLRKYYTPARTFRVVAIPVAPTSESKAETSKEEAVPGRQ